MTDDETREPDEPWPKAGATNKEIAQAIRQASDTLFSEGAAEVRPLERLPPELTILERQDLAQDIRLKKYYAFALIGGLGVQVIIANVLVYLYAWKGVHWRMSPSVINAWLGATVIQVIGVVFVVTRYLFPRRDVRRRRDRR